MPVQKENRVFGTKGEKGDPFAVAKTYPSVAAMNAGFATDGVKEGGFVVINTENVEDEDNAKLYVKGKSAYTFLTDLSGAQGMKGPQGERVRREIREHREQPVQREKKEIKVQMVHRVRQDQKEKMGRLQRLKSGTDIYMQSMNR